MIDLKPFCSTDVNRVALTVPFNRDGFTYACDGRIAIRVNQRELSTDSAGVNMLQLGDYQPHGYAFDIPALPDAPPPTKCERCAGTGRVRKCPDCDGDGTKECPECGNEDDCRRCGGSGSLGPADNVTSGVHCFSCEGTGAGKQELQTVMVGPASYDTKYLRMIAALPNAKLWITDEFSACFFQFDGGCGYLMPMRMPR